MTSFCSGCHRPLRIDPDVQREMADPRRVHLFGAPPSLICGPECQMSVSLVRSMIQLGWMLTPPMLRQEARA